MKLLMLTMLFISSHALAQQAGWGVSVKEADKKVKIGGRLQGIMVNDSETESQDFYMRRVRLNLEYRPWEDHSFVYDIRNDSSGKDDDGENEFVIGDAYWNINIKKNTVKNVRFFRSKVDVSYSQTSSSKNLFNPNRASSSEYASDFVVQNRRAMNVQVNGQVKNLTYHFVLSDGVNTEDLKDLSKNSIDKVNHQKFTYGGKLRYFFIGASKADVIQDTFYGQLDTLSLGLGYFANDKINVDNSTAGGAGGTFSFRRTVTNLDLSYAYKNFRLLAEQFSFVGNLIDLKATNKDNILGNSNGYYIQTEYLLGKWAPYIIYESFNKNQAEDDFNEIANTIGLNYYQNMEAERFGIAYKQTKLAKNLGYKTNESLYVYLMLNY